MVPTYDGGSERPTSRRLHRQHTAAPPPPVAAQWCAASSRCSVSHTTIPKLVAATLCGLRPFALPRSLIPPKSHAALVSFNQQHQPSLEAKLASKQQLAIDNCCHSLRRRMRRRRAAARCPIPSCAAMDDAMMVTFAAFSTNQSDFLLVGNADNALFLHWSSSYQILENVHSTYHHASRDRNCFISLFSRIFP